MVSDMATFITLETRGMYQGAAPQVTINADNIASMERDEDFHLTDVRLTDGHAFSVAQTPQQLIKMIEEIRSGK